MKNRKGISIFTLDSIVAVSIIMVGIILVFFRISAYEPLPGPSIEAGDNMLNFFSTVKMRNLGILGIVPGANPDNTIFEQIGEWYYLGDGRETWLAGEAAKFSASPDIGVNISINGTDLWVQRNPENAILLIPFRKIIYGTAGPGEFWQYVVEVQVWQE